MELYTGQCLTVEVCDQGSTAPPSPAGGGLVQPLRTEGRGAEQGPGAITDSAGYKPGWGSVQLGSDGDVSTESLFSLQ